MAGPETLATERAGLVEVAERVRAWRSACARAVFARVIDLQGFSTWSGDELVAVAETGEQAGDVLGRYGADRLGPAAEAALGGPPALGRVLIEVEGSRIAEAGLSCGGQAELLLQPAEAVPAELWEALAERRPVALLTRLDGPAAGPTGAVVTGQGELVGPSSFRGLVPTATEALASGYSRVGRVEDPEGAVLLEAWVPQPRIVVVGSGELAEAIRRQGALLGWEARATEDLDQLEADLAWAGASSALVVLSHDPELDVAALAAGLSRRVAYVGAMGSRRTQTRRLEALLAAGADEAEIERIHRPIGLDLGGRSASEVALAICAEILAARCGRDGRPLAERQGAIHDRPAVSA